MPRRWRGHIAKAATAVVVCALLYRSARRFAANRVTVTITELVRLPPAGRMHHTHPVYGRDDMPPMVQGRVELTTCLTRSYRFALELRARSVGAIRHTASLRHSCIHAASLSSASSVCAESCHCPDLTVTRAHAMVDRYALEEGAGVYFTPACASHAGVLEYCCAVSPARREANRAPTQTEQKGCARRSSRSRSRDAGSRALKVVSCIVCPDRQRCANRAYGIDTRMTAGRGDGYDRVGCGADDGGSRGAEEVCDATATPAAAMRCVLEVVCTPALAAIHGAEVRVSWPAGGVQILSIHTVPDGCGAAMVDLVSHIDGETQCVWDLSEACCPAEQQQRATTNATRRWVGRSGTLYAPSPPQQQSSLSGNSFDADHNEADADEPTWDERDGLSASCLCRMEVVYRPVAHTPETLRVDRFRDTDERRVGRSGADDDVRARDGANMEETEAEAEEEEDTDSVDGDEVERADRSPHPPRGGGGAFAHCATSMRAASSTFPTSPCLSVALSTRSRKRRERGVHRQSQRARRTHASPELWFATSGGQGNDAVGPGDAAADLPRVTLSYRVAHLVSGLTIRRLRVVKESAHGNWPAEGAEGWGWFGRYVRGKLAAPLTRLAHYTTWVIQPIAVTRA